MTQSLHPDDPRLTWQGVVSLHHTDDWTAPWRLPYEQRMLFYPERLRERLSMPAGARLAFFSDTTRIAGQLAHPHAESAPIDLCCDGELVASLPLAGRDSFRFEGLPEERKLVELWLPQFGTFHLRGIELSDGASVSPFHDSRSRWITYGSSITQCRGAESPTQTWPAIVARSLGLNLLCLGVGGECHFDQMMARLIRDQPADLISLALGINVLGGASLSPRTFRPAVIGFVRTIRDGHPEIPIIVRSAIASPSRETTPNAVGMTLEMTRHEVQAAVETLVAHGDPSIHYVDGQKVLDTEHAHLLPDGLHPNAEGYKLMGRNTTPIVAEFLRREE
jgi:lysophospholipase L1-like esterase